MFNGGHIIFAFAWTMAFVVVVNFSARRWVRCQMLLWFQKLGKKLQVYMYSSMIFVIQMLISMFVEMIEWIFLYQ